MPRTLSAGLLTICILALGRTASSQTPYPVEITTETRANPDALAALEKPGKILFTDGFESDESLKSYFDITGLKEGNTRLINDPGLAHTGKGAVQFTAPARGGGESGVRMACWFGPEGHDRVYFRRYIRFSRDYDQGDLHHVGGGMEGVAGDNRWAQMGKAGIRPGGEDRFTSSFEPWKDWGKYPAPGYMFLYTYWMDMKQDRDGHYWGNNLAPAESRRITLQKERWYCLEQMIKVNDPGQANGELGAWIDGKLYLHYRGFRWRSTADVKIQRFNIGLYVHHAAKDNTVWYDDVALSTGYIGPLPSGGVQIPMTGEVGRRLQIPTRHPGNFSRVLRESSRVGGTCHRPPENCKFKVMPAEEKPLNPLVSIVGLAGAAGGWGLSQYCGAILWIPGIATVALVLLFLKTPVHPRFFKGAIAVCGGHAVWFTFGALLTNQWLLVIPDIIFLLAGIIWLWTRPGLAAAVFLGVFQLASLGLNIWRIVQIEFGTLEHKALVAHIVFRIIVIIFLFANYQQMRPPAENAVSPPPVPEA